MHDDQEESPTHNTANDCGDDSDDPLEERGFHLLTQDDDHRDHDLQRNQCDINT